MINVFVLHNGRLSQINVENREDLENTLPIWVDLTDPNEDERGWVKSIYGVTLPGEDEVKDIEASARYYEADNGDLHLRTDFLIDDDDEPASTVTVAFILARDILFRCMRLTYLCFAWCACAPAHDRARLPTIRMS